MSSNPNPSRTEKLTIRLTADEKAELTWLAGRHGKSVSDWARRRLLVEMFSQHLLKPSQASGK